MEIESERSTTVVNRKRDTTPWVLALLFIPLFFALGWTARGMSSDEPSSSPSALATSSPTPSPTSRPSASPSVSPSPSASLRPSPTPTPRPSASPTLRPSPSPVDDEE